MVPQEYFVYCRCKPISDAYTSLFGVFERRQHGKPLLRPARQHDLVVGVEPEAVIPHDHQVGAYSEETTNR
jgi:hypothetical protein